MRLLDFITDRLYARVWKTIRSRAPDVNIGRDETGEPYMQRWWVIPRNRFFNIYLHHYLHDDDRILHSHPWWSVSICVSGGLAEFYTPTSDDANFPPAHKTRNVRRGDVIWRSPDMFHRLEIAESRTITIFITGPKIKTWYFACKKGLMHWTEHVEGGCGEDDTHYTI